MNHGGIMQKTRLFLLLCIFLIMCVMMSCNYKKEDTNKIEKTEKIQLTWALWDQETTYYYQQLIDAYEEINPHIKIDILDLGSRDYNAMLRSQLLDEDNIIDIIIVKDTPGYTSMVYRKQLEPLDDLIKSMDIKVSSYISLLEELRMDDSIYALPCRNDFNVLYYNKDLFDAAGMEYPRGDLTFEEYDKMVREVSKKATAALGRHIYGAHYHSVRSQVQSFAILDGKHSIIDGRYEFLKPYYEMVLGQQKDKICQDFAGLKAISLHYSAAFYQNNVATLTMGTWFVSTLIEAIQNGTSPVKNWGVVACPRPEGVKMSTSVSTLTSIGVNASSKHKKEAKEFISFVAGFDGAKILATTGNLPAIQTKEILEILYNIDGFPDDIRSKRALQSGKTYMEFPISDYNAELEVLLNEFHNNVMIESVELDEAIKALERDVKRILKD